MFRILVVEDDTNKLRNICKILESINGVTEDLIDHEVDGKSAKSKLRKNHYDLLIVDIAIPSFKSGQVELDGGINLVEEILNRPLYKIPSNIIGLTALTEIFEKAKDRFNSNILSVIRYSDSDNEWETKLYGGVSNWVKTKVGLDNAVPDYNYDVAIITAVDVEFNAVKNLSDNWKRIQVNNDSTTYLETDFEDGNGAVRVIICCLPQMGMNACSVVTMKIVHNFRPRYLFMTGIAASLKDSYSHGYGDILVIDESWDGGAGKIVTDGQNQTFEPVALHLRLDRDLAEKMKSFAENKELLREIKDKFRNGKTPNTELAVHLGSVVSVAGVIANKQATDHLKLKDRKILGLEMETYGMYYSVANCSLPRPKVMALKSVCDFADESKGDSYQSYAAYTSASLLFHFIMKECIA